MLHGSELTITVATSSTGFLGANPRRVGLIISSPRTNRVTISVKNPAVLDNGLTLQPAVNPVILRPGDAGNWLQSNLFAIANSASETITVIEVLEP